MSPRLPNRRLSRDWRRYGPVLGRESRADVPGAGEGEAGAGPRVRLRDRQEGDHANRGQAVTSAASVGFGFRVASTKPSGARPLAGFRRRIFRRDSPKARERGPMRPAVVETGPSAHMREHIGWHVVAFFGASRQPGSQAGQTGLQTADPTGSPWSTGAGPLRFRPRLRRGAVWSCDASGHGSSGGALLARCIRLACAAGSGLSRSDLTQCKPHPKRMPKAPTAPPYEPQASSRPKAPLRRTRCLWSVLTRACRVEFPGPRGQSAER